jgi:FkbM family methyltransferase
MNTAIGLVGRAVRTLRPRGRHHVARFLHRFFADRTLSYLDRWGYRHVADLSDPSESLAFVGKPSLPPELHWRLRPGDWVVDAGANVGVLTAELRRIVGGEGVVWAFEPLPRNIERLRALREANGLSNVQIFAGALSSESAVARLALPLDGNSAHPSLAKTTDVADTIEVQTWALDAIEPPSPTARLRFIKIDVEGHEPALLRGATTRLRTMRPMILCEFNDRLLREGGSSAAALLAQFSALGYRPTQAFREGRPLGGIAVGSSPWAIVPIDWMVADLLMEPVEGQTAGS